MIREIIIILLMMINIYICRLPYILHSLTHLYESFIHVPALKYYIMNNYQ